MDPLKKKNLLSSGEAGFSFGYLNEYLQFAEV